MFIAAQCQALCAISAFISAVLTTIIDHKLLQQVMCSNMIQTLWKLSAARGNAPGESLCSLNCRVAGHLLYRNLAHDIQFDVSIFPKEHGSK
jgi:hypothetical protein